VASVLAQTFNDWELVVYDVGKEPVESLIPKDPRIRYVRGECRGPAADFQAALELATGNILSPLSDDDRLPRHALGTAVAALGQADWLVGRTVLVTPKGEPIAFRGGCYEHVEETRHGMYMLGGAVYWRKTLTDRLGGFRSEFDGAADFDLYRRFLKHTEPAICPDVLYLYTDHDDTDTRVNAERQQDATRRIMAAA
jgi:glycosyltransferase involved in cell wall biosynthesis